MKLRNGWAEVDAVLDAVISKEFCDLYCHGKVKTTHRFIFNRMIAGCCLCIAIDLLGAAVPRASAQAPTVRPAPNIPTTGAPVRFTNR